MAGCPRQRTWASKLSSTPRCHSFAGIVLFHQAVAIDIGFNALGLRASQGLKLTLGKGFKSTLEVGAI